MSPSLHGHSEPPPVSITQVEFLPDRLRVHFHCARPWGAADGNEVREVRLADIATLPILPRDRGHGEFREAWEEEVPIPTLGVTLLFRFAQWQETDDCRMVGLVGGPYRAAPQPGPSA